MVDQFKQRTRDLYKTLCNRGGITFTLEELRAALEATLGKRPLCQYCNCLLSIDNVSADHAIPVSRGGKNDLANIDFICKHCNKAKGNWTPAEFKTVLYYLEAAESKHNNLTIKKRVISSLVVAQSFEKGAQRRRSKS